MPTKAGEPLVFSNTAPPESPLHAQAGQANLNFSKYQSALTPSFQLIFLPSS
jgi:hypothetical protein